jgi:tetratricopeptide (TPR) repeat protein
MDAQDLDAAREQAEFDKLLTAARVFRNRGDYAKAAELVTKMLEMRPHDLDAREFAADILFARGEWEKAAAAYKAIYSEDPSRTRAEEKYAKATIQFAEGTRQKELLKYVVDHPAEPKVLERNPLLALLVSLAPGFGQVYCGQFVKGIVLFAATMVFWLLFYVLSPDVSAIPRDVRATYFVRNLDVSAVVCAVSAVCVHLYALVDAPVQATKSRGHSAV